MTLDTTPSGPAEREAAAPSAQPAGESAAPTRLPAGDVPTAVLPLVDDVRRDRPPEAALQALARSLGFDSATYAATSAALPARERRSYIWTTSPPDWVLRYEARAHVEVDPRIAETRHRATPLLWDRYAFPATTKLREFFDDAAKHGIASGIAVGLRDASGAGALLTLNSSLPRLDAAARDRINRIQGEILVVAHYVHALMMETVVDPGVPAPSWGASLSPRERECVQLAARGLSSRRIGVVLALEQRIVNYHFGNVLAKLNAATRHEAVARAVATGIVEP
jgi:LuxR family quorum-sensing system transcriptional regulator SolR